MRLENTPLVYLDINTENIIMVLRTLPLILETSRINDWYDYSYPHTFPACLDYPEIYKEIYKKSEYYKKQREQFYKNE